MIEKLKGLYLRYREPVNYLIFGGLTTLMNLVCYALAVGPLGMEVTPGNLLSWFVAVTFAFVTNKQWVFASKSWAFPLWLKEAGAFYAGRIFSGLVELGGLPLLMWLGLDQTLFGIDGFAAKIVVTVVVIILNYFLSKFIAFRKKKDA